MVSKSSIYFLTGNIFIKQERVNLFIKNYIVTLYINARQFYSVSVKLMAQAKIFIFYFLLQEAPKCGVGKP